MFEKISSTELAYTKEFSDYIENEKIIRFSDGKIPDMYNHNYTFIKDNISKEEFINIILEEIENRKEQNATFLRIVFNAPIEDSYFSDLPITPEISKYDYMYINPKMYDHLNGKECIVRKGISKEVLNDGKEVDVQANQANLGIEFATRRIKRKLEAYQQGNPNFNLFVCYSDDKPIGNCEFLINNEIAKIEDFDVIEEYQRKGFGTSIIKHLLIEAINNDVEVVYLITESDDTAKEMYSKCGLVKIGEKTELFFKL